MKDKNTTAILALVGGGFGVHRFYLGNTGLGVLYLLFCWTFIPAGVAFIEFIIFLTMSQEAFNAKYNHGLAAPAPMMQLQPQNIVVNVAQNTAAAGGAPSDLGGQIKQLHDLKVAGALTEEEFAVEKHKLLTGKLSS